MKFGVLEDISGVDLSLPEDPKITSKQLESLTAVKETRFNIGCSVWSEKAYVGSIYPAKTKPADFLLEYGKQFNSIEVNATRYGTPPVNQLVKWKNTVPDNFKFCLKIPQGISHSKELNSELVKDRLDKFLAGYATLENKAGTCFMQMSQHFKPDRLNQLSEFLNKLPIDLDLAVEIRHEDWFKTIPVTLHKILKDRNFSWVITDTPGRRDVLHQLISTNKIFVRFVGNNLHSSDYERINAWCERLCSWSHQGIKEVNFFIHQPAPNKHKAAELARRMIQKLNSSLQINLKPPLDYSEKSTLKLFN